MTADPGADRRRRIRLGEKRVRTIAKVLLLGATASTCPGASPARADGLAGSRPRLIVMTDIGPKPDPDDAQSLVRLLVYANEFEIEGLVATTASMHSGAVHPDYITERIEAYAAVRANLSKHAAGYPTAGELLDRVKAGSVEAGMEGVGPGRDSEGSEWILSVVDGDPRPVWVLAWGGANTLAQALWRVRHERSPPALRAFVSRLRVFASTDQDDSAAWLRETFPDLFYIGRPEGYTGRFATLLAVLTLGRRYTQATPTGVGGGWPFGVRGADGATVSNAWLTENVRTGHGPLGALYPRTRFLMEGDSASFLYLLPNGLGVPEHPEYGSWGGRYEREGGIYTDADDTVVGSDGETYTSNYATIWRWREAYQRDFAARMDWCVKAPREANHPPVAVLEHPDSIQAEAGSRVRLGAAGSFDPDGDDLSYEWFHYPEAGSYRGTLPIGSASSREVAFVAPRVTSPATAHVILRVRDDGEPSLTRYRRVRITLLPAAAGRPAGPPR